MKRRQLFEFEDLQWFPVSIRNHVTDFLRTVSEKFNLFGPVVPILPEFCNKCGYTKIVDLASGGGGQWGSLSTQLAKEVPDLQVTLTDKYPNKMALSKITKGSPNVFQYIDTPVDATAVPNDLSGVRTMFLSLHHFSPDLATRILSDAVSANTPIAVFEAQQRNVEHVIRFSLSPLAVLLLTPLIRPFSLHRLLFTYLIPIVPFIVGWDGVVSVLRTYTPEEMLKLCNAADPQGRFIWNTETIVHGQQKIQTLTGRPNNH